jgi:hypothetical protein
MADIRVERKGGTKAWLWVLLALIVIALAVFLLYQAGYIGGTVVAAQVEPTGQQQAPLARLALTVASHMQEVLHG